MCNENIHSYIYIHTQNTNKIPVIHMSLCSVEYRLLSLGSRDVFIFSGQFILTTKYIIGIICIVFVWSQSV